MAIVSPFVVLGSFIAAIMEQKVSPVLIFVTKRPPVAPVQLLGTGWKPAVNALSVPIVNHGQYITLLEIKEVMDVSSDVPYQLQVAFRLPVPK